MWYRPAAAAALFLVTAVPAAAQVSNVYSRALPPDKAALERLNLKIEWTAHIPVEGRRDTLTQIQTFDDQIFVQTRTGLLIAGDAATGRLQWFAQLGNGEYATTFPVAANSKYVFAANVTRLWAFHRYTGAVEFSTDVAKPGLRTHPQAISGLAADEGAVYCTLGTNRVAAYNLPRPIAISPAPGAAADPNAPPVRDPRGVNPIDDLANRYPPPGVGRTNLPDTFDPPRRSVTMGTAVGGFGANPTPSLATLARVTPPYTLDNGSYTPSVNLLPSLRQPYRLRNDFQKDIQRTPSISTIPPSVAAALALTDLRPGGIEPPLRWEYSTTSRILYPPFLTQTRVWLSTEGKVLTALSKRDGTVELLETLADPISAPPGRAGVISYVPLGSGFVYAVEGSSGNLAGGANILWRAVVGGINNRTPFVTDDFVYAQGDDSGVVCVNRKTGDPVWRSEASADRVLAANHEFLYVRDRQGRFLVYDAKRPTDPANRYSAPLSGMDLREFNIPVTNTASDRVYLAADNGLIVCLRDMSPKYAKPVRISPEVIVNLPPGEGVVVDPKKGGEPKKDPGEPKKDPADPKVAPPVDPKVVPMDPKKDPVDPKKKM